MKKIMKITGVLVLTFALVANLQYALLNYGISGNSLNSDVLAQTDTGTTGGTSTGEWELDGCPAASITRLSYQLNNVSSCSCQGTKKRKIIVNPETGEFRYEYETYYTTGMENTCRNTNKSTDFCDAFACSTTQS